MKKWDKTNDPDRKQPLGESEQQPGVQHDKDFKHANDPAKNEKKQEEWEQENKDVSAKISDNKDRKDNCSENY